MTLLVTDTLASRLSVVYISWRRTRSEVH